jgi:superfamily II DNA or RNA helicase
MSVKIKRDTLTKEQKTKISEDLTFYPIRIGKRFGKRVEIKGEPIICYDSETTKDYVFLPYNYANNLFPEHLNFKIAYPLREYNFRATLRERQLDIVEESKQKLNKYKSILMKIDPGEGKTCMSLYLASELRVPVIVIMTKTILLDSWKSTVKDFTDCENIWIVGSTPEPEKIPTITLCMDKRISKIPEKFLPKYGILIIDEAHEHCTEARIKGLLTFTPLFVIALSATPVRPEKTFGLMEAICGKKSETMIERIKKKEECIMYKTLTKVSVPIQKNSRDEPDFDDLMTKLYNSEERNKLILNIINEHKDRKIIVMTSRKFHAQIIHDKLKEQETESQIITGDIKTKDIKDCGISIVTISKGGVGFDIKTVLAHLDVLDFNTMILAHTTKSEILIPQIIGRCRDPKSIFFHLVDENYISKGHYAKAQTFYKSRNMKIKNY